MAPVQGAFQLPIGSTTLTLLPQRAVWLACESTLLVADLHLGKAVSFRRQGVPVPRGTSTANLERLTHLATSLGARRLILLGDFLHSAHAHAASTLGALARWRKALPDVEITLVRGNHDDRAGDPPSWLDAQCVDEPFVVAGGKLAWCHHPQAVNGAFVVAGHTHPSVVIAHGFERVRLPCFHVLAHAMIVPAFGEFTGTHPIDREPGDQVYAVAGDRIVPVS